MWRGELEVLEVEGGVILQHGGHVHMEGIVVIVVGPAEAAELVVWVGERGEHLLGANTDADGVGDGSCGR